MSRTDAHTPFRVRIARGDLTAFAAHDHTAGSCDLPPRNHIDHSLHQTACRWEWVYDGTNVCSCQLCHEGKAHRRQRRRTRHMVREALHTAAIRWNSSVADVPIPPPSSCGELLKTKKQHSRSGRCSEVP